MSGHTLGRGQNAAGGRSIIQADARRRFGSHHHLGALFYKNYGQADIPAFGDVARHLGYLRLILLRYLLVGGGLLAAWAAILYRKAPAAVLDKHKTVRQVRGH